jgi:hypothetical protein
VFFKPVPNDRDDDTEFDYTSKNEAFDTSTLAVRFVRFASAFERTPILHNCFFVELAHSDMSAHRCRFRARCVATRNEKRTHNARQSSFFPLNLSCVRCRIRRDHRYFRLTVTKAVDGMMRITIAAPLVVHNALP